MGCLHFDWPDYRTARLMELNAVLDEQDVLPVMVLHDFLVLAKLGQHIKQRFTIGTKAETLMSSRAHLFGMPAQTNLFQYNHNRTSRFDYAGLGNWDIFSNIINVQAEQGLTE